MKARHTLARALAWIERRPLGKLAVLCAAGAAGGFLLAQIRAAGTYLPVAPALVAALPFSPVSVFVYLGAAAGYVCGWGLDAALEPLAAGFLILAGSCIFQDLSKKQRRWFLPLLSCAVYTMMGLVVLVGCDFALPDTTRMLLRLLVLWVCSRGFLKTAEADPKGYCISALSCLAVLSNISLWPGFPVSLLCCTALTLLFSTQTQALGCAVGCGLLLQITCQPALPVTAVFCAGVIFCRGVRYGSMMRAICFVLFFAGAIALSDGADAEYIIGVMAGAAVSCFLPESWARATCREPEGCADASILQAAELFQTISRILGRASVHCRRMEPAAVFDQAAEHLCACCSGYPNCWQRCGENTWRELSSVAGVLVKNGMVEKHDLPRSFSARCIQPEEFCAALNHAVEQQRARLQCQEERRQLKRITCSQYGYLAEFLQQLAQSREKPASAQYAPEMGVCACSKQGESVSGNQGAQFISRGQYYLLLCDGMGTGAGADTQAREAVSLLRQMLILGFEPLEAMKMLNDLYILKADGGFATVDLLQVDLAAGIGFLHKWGAAPSYLCTDEGVKRIGTATIPPGLDVGETHRTSCVRLSLQDGEQVVLTTDGIQADECKRFLEGMGHASARELAAGIVASAGASADDRTAVVVRLHRLQGQSYHTTRKKRSLSKQHVSSNI